MKAVDDGELALVVGAQRISGWTDVRVRAGLDSFPRSFEIGITERYPGEFNAVTIKPGDPCEVYIGADRVVTGYVDRYLPLIDANAHSIKIIGRGACCDLVDCSAQWPGNEINNATLISIAQKLADPYGIAVENVGDPGGVVPQFNITWGETAYQIIQRVAAYEGLIPYELPSGDLMISTVGQATHASGFVQGDNVERAAANFGVDQRYATYVVRLLSFVDSDIIASGTDIVETIVDNDMSALKLRNGQPRNRFLYIVCESGRNSDIGTAKRRGEWEASLRAGRSFNVSLTCDSWRDSAGVLWTPNQFARIDLPSIKLPNRSWLIADVIFRRDASGTHADLVLMPKEAFIPEPFLLAPILRGVVTPGNQ